MLGVTGAGTKASGVFANPIYRLPERRHMTLSEEERERLAELVDLQPTKNSDLQDRWGLDSGSDVHQYLEDHLRDYYYRDENSMIRATAEASELVGDVDEDGEAPAIHMSDTEQMVFAVIAGPDERSESVVSVLHAVRDEYVDADLESGDIRRALQTLKRKGIVAVENRTVPTYRLAVPREDVTIADD
jgi:predicted Fe-Mo cluster-binding NifX family protein